MRRRPRVVGRASCRAAPPPAPAANRSLPTPIRPVQRAAHAADDRRRRRPRAAPARPACHGSSRQMTPSQFPGVAVLGHGWSVQRVRHRTAACTSSIDPAGVDDADALRLAPRAFEVGVADALEELLALGLEPVSGHSNRARAAARARPTSTGASSSSGEVGRQSQDARGCASASICACGHAPARRPGRHSSRR